MAQNNLGGCYKQGQGVPQDYAEAVKWYRKAAEQGLAGGQFNLGLCYYYGQGVPQNYAEAVKWCRKVAEQGVAAAQVILGGCYAQDQGVQKNDVEAYKWFNLAAAQGESNAVGYRERTAAHMTPDQIAEAQRLFSAFVSRKQDSR